MLCVEIGYLVNTDILEAMQLAEEVGKMLSALIQKLTTAH